MAKTLLTAATMTGYTPHSDRSMTFRFRTQELSDAQKMDAITHHLSFGWLGFVDSEDATDLEIPAESPIRDDESPSQRLRKRMFVYYREVKKGDPKDFEAWRARELEIIGEKYLDKINL
jgi:hypothetical protein